MSIAANDKGKMSNDMVSPKKEFMNQEAKVTEIEFIPIKPSMGLIGFISFVLDEKYFVGSVAVYTRLDGSGYRLVYPTKKVGVKNVNVFHPISKEVGKAIDEAVINKINELFDEKYEDQFHRANG